MLLTKEEVNELGAALFEQVKAFYRVKKGYKLSVSEEIAVRVFLQGSVEQVGKALD